MIAQINISSATPVAVVTNTGKVDTVVLSMIFCNTTSSQVTVSVYVVKAGGSAGNGSLIMKDFTIDAGDTYFVSAHDKILLGQNDALYAKSSGATIATISYTTM